VTWRLERPDRGSLGDPWGLTACCQSGTLTDVAEQRHPDDPWTGFALAIFRVNGLITRAGEGISRPVGQSSARWQVLGRAFEPQTVAAMARDMGQARQSVQRIADALVIDGLVGYKAHPTDRRTKLLELTPRGQEVLSAIYVRQLAWSEGVVAKLSAAKLAEVAAVLDEIGDALDSEIERGS
jgi:DNA-binding MarR family transcriptional regulator